MKVASKKITWTASPDTDVTNYNVYCVPISQTLGYDSPTVSVPAATTEYILPGVFNITQGEYHIGVSAEDSLGNESDIVSVSVPLDFLAPSPVTNLRVVDL